jgi:predicted AlkP superfamily phosphohydrolase/phosphomutase
MKTIIIGFDAFDPHRFERLHEQGRLPHLSSLVEQGGYARFGVSDPPQSEVSWTSIATGLDAGGHGIFDFVHRDPDSYTPYVSLLPTKRGLMGTQFTPPHEARTIFQYAVEQGYPATSLWWPATFPARLDSPVRTVPGLGTPDILGRLGAGHFFTPDSAFAVEDYKTHINILNSRGERSFQGFIHGPLQKAGAGAKQAGLNFRVEWEDDDRAILRIQDQTIPLVRGEWSPFLHLRFRVRLGMSVHALTRAMLSEHPAAPGIYFLPLQIHPLHSPWPYSQPKSLSKQLWNQAGPYLSLGWPQDTTGLEEGFLSDEAFLDLCESVMLSRKRAFLHQLSEFKEGLLAVVFDSLDRVQHMFWKDRPDIIDLWYEKLDALFGGSFERIQDLHSSSARVLVVSDHGFTEFDFKAHLNRWLIEEGFLHPKQEAEKRSLEIVDWSRTKAYALGLNSVYLNLERRERQGIVVEQERRAVVGDLRARLLAWKGPGGRNVVSAVLDRDEAFDGPMAEFGPDLLVGYARGFRASAQTGLGRWGEPSIERNTDHWSGDHCVHAELVPGVVFSTHPLEDRPNPTYREFPELVLGQRMEGMPPGKQKPPEFSDEDRDVLEERLKDLGYL